MCLTFQTLMKIKVGELRSLLHHGPDHVQLTLLNWDNKGPDHVQLALLNSNTKNVLALNKKLNVNPLFLSIAKILLV